LWNPDAIALMDEKIVSEHFDVHIMDRNTERPTAKVELSKGEFLDQILISCRFARKIKDEASSVSDEHSVNESEHARDNQSNSNAHSSHVNDDPQQQWYVEQELPVGIPFDVCVTQVDSPNIVFAQRFPPSDSDPLHCNDCNDLTAKNGYREFQQLQDMYDFMNDEEGDFVRLLEDIERPTKGMPCCCYYEEDEAYYRAKIEVLQLMDDPPSAKVLLVDYGTSSIVPISKIKKLPERMIELPTQCTKFEIVGLKPPEDSTPPFIGDTNWPTESGHVFFKEVSEQRVIAEIVDDECFPKKINLFKMVTDDDSGERNKIHIGAIMDTMGHAKFTPYS